MPIYYSWRQVLLFCAGAAVQVRLIANVKEYFDLPICNKLLRWTRTFPKGWDTDFIWDEKSLLRLNRKHRDMCSLDNMMCINKHVSRATGAYNNQSTDHDEVSLMIMCTDITILRDSNQCSRSWLTRQLARWQAIMRILNTILQYKANVETNVESICKTIRCGEAVTTWAVMQLV